MARATVARTRRVPSTPTRNGRPTLVKVEPPEADQIQSQIQSRMSEGPSVEQQIQAIIASTPNRAEATAKIRALIGGDEPILLSSGHGMPLRPGNFPEGGPIDPRSHRLFHPLSIEDAAKGTVTPLGPTRTKVAMIGFAESTRMLAPFENPEYEIWGLNQLYRYLPRFDRWFEIHAHAVWMADMVRDSNYPVWLRECPVPIYMDTRDYDAGKFADIPNAVRFPLEESIKLAGRNYFQSSPSYMIAIALLEGFKRIEIYGIDLIIGREYHFEKANVEWWLGLAHGLGVEVYIPKESALLKQLYQYGPETAPPFWPISRDFVVARLTELQNKRDGLLTNLNGIEGAILAYKEIAETMSVVERGGSLVAGRASSVSSS